MALITSHFQVVRDEFTDTIADEEWRSLERKFTHFATTGGKSVTGASATSISWDELAFALQVTSRLTAAIPVENPYCSCRLTRVRSRCSG